MEVNKSLVVIKKKKLNYFFIFITLLIGISVCAGFLISDNKKEVIAKHANIHILSGENSGDDTYLPSNKIIVPTSGESNNLDNHTSEENLPQNVDVQIDEEESKYSEETNNTNEQISDEIDNINGQKSGEIMSGDYKSGDTIIAEPISGETNNLSGEIDNNVSGEIITKIRELDSNKPMVAITFDDGPDPKRSLQIIEIFQKNNSLATFFDIGNLMERYPNTVKKEIEAGFEVGGHTYTHANLNKLTKEGIQKEITNVENAYRNITGFELKYIRPSYGNANELVKETVEHPLVNWSVDSLDWKSRNADKVIAEIRKTKNLDGKIILMHSIYSSTVEAVERLVPELIEEGYQLVTVSELAYYKGYNLENGKVYYKFN